MARTRLTARTKFVQSNNNNSSNWGPSGCPQLIKMASQYVIFA